MPEEITEQRMTGNQSALYSKTSEKMLCPVCGVEVDMLIGEDTQDGGKRGCEKCWRPAPHLPTTPVKVDEHSGDMVQDFNKQYPKVEIDKQPEFPFKPAKNSPALEELKTRLAKGGVK